MLMHLTQLFLDLITGLLIGLAVGSFGLRITRFFALDVPGFLGRAIIGCVFGAAFVAYLMFLLGVLQLYYTQVAWLVLMGMLALNWRYIRILIEGTRRQLILVWRQIKTNRYTAIVLLLMVLSALVRVVGALSPPTSQDALIYHLTLPHQYVRMHGLGFVQGVQPYGQFPQNVEMLYLWGILLRSDTVAQLIHWGLGILLCGLVFILARMELPILWSLIAAMILYAGGDVAAQSGQADIDLAIAAFQVVAVVAIFHFFATGRKRWFVTSALFVGVAAGSKYTGVLIGLPLIMLVVWQAQRVWKWSTRCILGTAVAFGSIALLGVLPWLAKNAILVGNPVFPMFQTIFPTRVGVPAVDNLITPGFVPQIQSIKTLSGFLVSPMNLTFNPDAIIGGSYIGPIFLAILPFVFLTWSSLSREAKRLLFIGIFYFILWYWTVPYPRFLLGAVACLSVPAAVVCLGIVRRDAVWGSAIVHSTLLLWFVCGLAFSWHFYRSAFPYVLHIQSWDENAHARLPNDSKFMLYDEMKWLNQIGSDSSLVLVDDSRGYMIDRPFVTARDFPCSCNNDLVCEQNFASCLNRQQVRFVLLSDAGNARVPSISVAASRYVRTGKLTVVKQDALATLYEVVADGQ